MEAARGRLLCGYVAMRLCGSVAMELCSYVAIWLCGYVAMWLSSKMSNFQKVVCSHVPFFSFGEAFQNIDSGNSFRSAKSLPEIRDLQSDSVQGLP